MVELESRRLVSMSELQFRCETIVSSAGRLAQTVVSLGASGEKVTTLVWGNPATQIADFLNDPQRFLVGTAWEVVNDGYGGVNGPQAYGSAGGDHYQGEARSLLG